MNKEIKFDNNVESLSDDTRYKIKFDNNVESLSDDTRYKSDKDFTEQLKKTLELQNKELEQNLNLRKEYANKIYNFISLWSRGLFVILFFQGFSHMFQKIVQIEWNDNVILTLITTTFIQVLGLMIIVLKYLFPQKN